MATILETMKATKNLVEEDKHKLFIYLMSFPLSKPQLKKLYEINFEKGYDLNDT